MPEIVIRGPWPRRHVLGWCTAALGIVCGLKLAVREAAETPEVVRATVTAAAAPTRTRVASLSYTPRARRVLDEAQKEAFRRALPAYDQDDLLLGIAIVPDSAGLEILRRLGISQEQLRAEAESAVAAVPAHVGVNVNVASVLVKPAPRAQAMLALASDEALFLGHNYLGVEHLLLAMVRQGTGPGHGVLARLVVGLEAARLALKDYLSGPR